MVKLNISQFWLLEFLHRSLRCKVSKNLIINSVCVISRISKYKLQLKFNSCSVHIFFTIIIRVVQWIPSKILGTIKYQNGPYYYHHFYHYGSCLCQRGTHLRLCLILHSAVFPISCEFFMQPDDLADLAPAMKSCLWLIQTDWLNTCCSLHLVPVFECGVRYTLGKGMSTKLHLVIIGAVLFISGIAFTRKIDHCPHFELPSVVWFFLRHPSANLFLWCEFFLLLYIALRLLTSLLCVYVCWPYICFTWAHYWHFAASVFYKYYHTLTYFR